MQQWRHQIFLEQKRPRTNAQESRQHAQTPPAHAVSTPACSTTNMPTAGQYVSIILGNTSCALFAFSRQVAHLASASEFLTWISSVLESSPWPLCNTQQLCIAKESTNASNRSVARLLRTQRQPPDCRSNTLCPRTFRANTARLQTTVPHACGVTKPVQQYAIKRRSPASASHARAECVSDSHK